MSWLLAFWSDISLRLRKVLPLLSRPIPGPVIPAGSPRPKEGPKNYGALSYKDGEAGNSFWKGVEIIDVLLTAGI